MIRRLEDAVFNHRRAVLIAMALITGFLGFMCTRLRIDAGFEKLLPITHPYIVTFLQHQEEFGGANRLIIAVRAKDGDMFTPAFFETLKEVTDAVFFLPGVNRATVTSLYTPNVRFIEIVEGGFAGGNVIPADFQPKPEVLGRVRENILKAGIVGRLVANDFTAALVSAQLVENDPRTGERLDYLQVADRLEQSIRQKYQSDAFDVHIIGFAKTMGDIAAGAKGVLAFFGVALLISAVLVYMFANRWALTWKPLVCSIIAVVWTLGLLTLFGFGLDPMSLLVPFLVFAIGLSHGVQMVNATTSEVRRGATPLQAARGAFRRLIVPGAVALASDTVGFLTLLFIQIRIIRELALTASLGVMVIIVTNLLLLPVLLSYTRPEQKQGSQRGAWRARLWGWTARFAEPAWSRAVLVLALALLAWGYYEGRNLRIGDIHAGVPELRQDSRYNRDTAMITDKFSIGLDIITTIVETVPDGCTEHDVMATIDRFAWTMANVPGVQSTISLPQVAKIVNAGWNEGHLKWRTLPRNSQVMAQAVGSVETSTGLLNRDCSVMPVMIFLEDHRAETLDRVVSAVKEFARNNDSDRTRFRLATGSAGVMAATNEVVSDAQLKMLLWIYVAVLLLCLVTFRSWRAAVCIVLPLALVSVLAYALMSRLGIGLKTSTLPVAALGVGIGVDYAIYIFSRLREQLATGLSLRQAYHATLDVTGNAVLITGLTLAVGVSTWILSALQFQADMGVLLTFMFLANMLGALVLLPALAVWLIPANPPAAVEATPSTTAASTPQEPRG